MDVEVVPAVGFRDILVGVWRSHWPTPPVLPAMSRCRAGVIARRGGGKQPLHEQDPATNVLPVEVAAHAGLLDLNFAGAERLRRPDDGVVYRLIEIIHVVRVEADFRREERRIHHRSLLRGEPFSQVKSPNANGVCTSTAKVVVVAPGADAAAALEAGGVVGAGEVCAGVPGGRADWGGGAAAAVWVAWAICTLAFAVRFCATSTVTTGGLV